MKFSALLAILFAGATNTALANFIYDINTGNAALAGYSGTLAIVTVHLTDSTHATISFDSQTGGGNIFLMGSNGAAGVNVNATSWTLSSLSGSNGGTGFTPGPLSNGGASNEDGFGAFNQTIDSFDSFTHSFDHISFVLTNTSGSWASDGTVLTPNGNNAVVAAHIIVTTLPANAANSAIITGYAAGNGGDSPPNNVPEPQTLALLGLGLSGLALIRRQSTTSS